MLKLGLNDIRKIMSEVHKESIFDFQKKVFSHRVFLNDYNTDAIMFTVTVEYDGSISTSFTVQSDKRASVDLYTGVENDNELQNAAHVINELKHGIIGMASAYEEALATAKEQHEKWKQHHENMKARRGRHQVYELES